ncbi:OsmC family peroxiredoxin [bacterium]|nr:OsmC family peroxiredoxin [bacterium]
MGVQIDIVYEGDFSCKATHAPSTNNLKTDLPVDNGGQGQTFSPTDLVATALGTCLITIMGKVAEQEKIDLAGAQIQVMKEMAADPHRRIGELQTFIKIPKGKALTEKQKTKLENAAKLCPVKQSLHPDTKINLHFEYLD